ncbi:MAG: hypothetical protein WD894_13950 [Pirellulales bacterium]
MPPFYTLLFAVFLRLVFSAGALAQLPASGDAIAPIANRSPHIGEQTRSGETADAARSVDSAPAVRLDPVAFHDIQPGVSTIADLDAKWGAPVRDGKELGAGQRMYEIAPFKQVEVSLDQGKVLSIVAHLDRPAALAEATERFVPRAAGSVEVLDDAGQTLGVAFPERGVVFAYAPGAKDVAQVLFDPIDVESFYMRAERYKDLAPQQSLADLEFVLQKRGKHGPALALAAQIFYHAGQLADATAQIDAALQVEPATAAYRLTKAEILGESGDFTSAQQTCRQVLQQPNLPTEVKARALCLLGDVLANGPKRDYTSAIKHHLAAIQTAEPLTMSSRAVIRRAAKHTLVLANLGVANDIAWGYWQQKEKVVPKWLVAAHEAAEDLINHEGADESLHLLVLRRALAASAGTQGKLDPVAWTKEVVQTARRLIDQSEDPWRRSRLEWEVGLALYDALQADQARGYHDHALSNSSLVVKYLESSLQHRQATANGTHLLGRLYFRIGAIHAVELNDHRMAVTWFQKALPLLERPLPATALADMGRLGESFVSMGISFWEINQRNEAIRLTQHGLALVTQGVKNRVVDEDALTVPYSNLAFMHRELGNARQADGYAELASRLDAPQRQ